MNNTRFFIGDIVSLKIYPNQIGIIEYSYKDAFKSGSDREYSLCLLNESGEIYNSVAWKSFDELVLVDDSHRDENLQKIIKYNQSLNDGAPIAMDLEFAKKIGYTWVHTYETALKKAREDYK